jgi:hypothetical protein
MPMMRVCRSLWVGALLLGALSSAGCQPAAPAVPDPVTHAVSGSVVGKDGRPVAGGAIQFRQVEDSNQTSLGEIKPDGAFSLRTVLADGRKLDGAVAGTYQVTIFPPMDAPQGQPVVSCKQTYRVQAGENQLTIQLD